MQNKLAISSRPIEIAEYKNYKIATFLISVLDEYDRANRKITREAGEKFHKTIIGYPIVAKLVTDIFGNPITFGGHEGKKVRDKNGNVEIRFGTVAIGTVLDSYIEDRYVDGYDGLKSCIMIKCKLWSDRFPEYFYVLDKLWNNGKVESSWELDVSEYEEEIHDGVIGKVIKVFEFLGNCILGTSIPAVPGAGMVEYAELNDEQANDELALACALGKDSCGRSDIEESEQKEDNMTKKEKAENEVLGTEVSTPVAEDISIEAISPTTSIATDENTVDASANVVEKDVSLADTDNTEETSEINYAEMVGKLEEEVATKNNLIAELNTILNDLNSQISELNKFKERCDKEDADKQIAELKIARDNLRNYALDSKQIAMDELETDEFKKMISELDEAGIKSIISDRLVKSMNNNVETAEITDSKTVVPKAVLEDDEVINYKNVMKNFFGK